MADLQAPSLFGAGPTTGVNRAPGKGMPMAAPREANSLLDLLYDGFYMIFLLRNGYTASDGEAFRERVRMFLAAFERGGKRLQSPAEDIYQAKFAFCALVDEVVLMSRLEMRHAWGRRPLQLEFFGEQLAGERFFDNLEQLRRIGAPKVQVLEVYHLCLLLGFQGKYILEGSEKLGFLTARLGEEIALLKGKRAGFAPHWAPPDQVFNALRRSVPLWVIGSVFALLGLVAYLGMRWMLDRQTEADLGAYAQVVTLAPQAAYITITLP